MWYGLSSIAARFINYLLTPYLTFVFTSSQYGEMSVVYAFIPFMNVIFTYGLETGYFRFSTKENKQSVFNTTSISMIVSTVFLSIVVMAMQHPLATLLQITEHPEYLSLSAAIIALDAISTIPFAKLRQDGRPKKFAFIKVGGIITNIISIYTSIFLTDDTFSYLFQSPFTSINVTSPMNSPPSLEARESTMQMILSGSNKLDSTGGMVSLTTSHLMVRTYGHCMEYTRNVKDE